MVSRKLMLMKENSDRLKGEAVKKKATKSLGQELADFVRKKVDLVRTNTTRKSSPHVESHVAALIRKEKGSPLAINGFLDYVKSKLTKEDHRQALINVRKRDEIKNLVPKFDK